jgi:hypothetical protein
MHMWTLFCSFLNKYCDIVLLITLLYEPHNTAHQSLNNRRQTTMFLLSSFFRGFHALTHILWQKFSDHCSVDIRLIYGWYTVDIRLIHGWYTVDTRLICGWYAVDIRLIHGWYTVDTRLIQVDIRLIYGWYTVDIRLINRIGREKLSFRLQNL